MMGEMVERVAQAIYYGEQDAKKGMLTWEMLGKLSPDTKKAIEAIARKAVVSMLEPTGEMMFAANEATPEGFHWSMEGVDHSGARIIWKAMVKEALK